METLSTLEVFVESTIIGIDPSSKTGITVIRIDDGDIQCMEMTEINTKEKGFSRLVSLPEKILEVVNKYSPDAIFIEGYAFSSRFNSAFQQELGGILRHLLVKNQYPLYEVPPTTLKKFVTGKGNSKKDLMMLEAYKRWGVEGTDNQIDSYGLAMFGVAVFYDLNFPKQHLEAVEAWKKTHPTPVL